MLPLGAVNKVATLLKESGYSGETAVLETAFEELWNAASTARSRQSCSTPQPANTTDSTYFHLLRSVLP